MSIIIEQLALSGMIILNLLIFMFLSKNKGYERK